MRKRPFRGYCAAGCGKPVFARPPKAKYCSMACTKLRFARSRRICTCCNKTLKRHQQKYCSVKCQWDYDFQTRAAKLEAGNYPTDSCNRFIRRYLSRRFGEKCSRCGWAERHPITKRIPIEVEHIDGNYKNNRLDNLTLLCPNCHSLTETFRALNRGRGRPMREGGRENPLNPKPKTVAVAFNQKGGRQRAQGHERSTTQLGLLPPTWLSG